MQNVKELTLQEMQQVNGGDSLKNLGYAMGYGVAGGAGLGAAICAPTVVAAPGCAIVGGLYGAVAGAFGAAIDSKGK